MTISPLPVAWAGLVLRLSGAAEGRKQETEAADEDAQPDVSVHLLRFLESYPQAYRKDRLAIGCAMVLSALEAVG